MSLVGVVLQARLGSTRLPRKVIRPFFEGKSILQCMIRRLVDEGCGSVVVACPTKDVAALEDHLAGDFMTKEKVFGGPEHDVLRRYYYTAREHGLDYIVRVTGDCPLVDPKVVDTMIDNFGDCDYFSNVFPWRTMPSGFDIEIFTMDALREAQFRVPQGLNETREHVTPYFHAGFVRGLYTPDPPWTVSMDKLSVDTQEDFDRVQRIYAKAVALGGEHFTYQHVMQVLREVPCETT